MGNSSDRPFSAPGVGRKGKKKALNTMAYQTQNPELQDSSAFIPQDVQQEFYTEEGKGRPLTSNQANRPGRGRMEQIN